MPRAKRYARIAITLPADDLAAADALARDRQRSRSWVIAEAIRRYAAEPAAIPSRPGIGPLRLAQLAADLRLTPEERVRESEQTARTAGRTVRAHRIIGFDRLEDYFAWKKLEELGA